jgi:hypothetical protein
MSIPFTDAPVGCSLGRHAWRSFMSATGDYYEVCRDCGKQAAWTHLGRDAVS